MLSKSLISITNIACPGQWLSRGVAVLCLFGLMGVASATTYVLPSKDDVVGQVKYARAKASETLQQIARRYDMGYLEIKAANPDFDPGKLKQGQRIVIPARHILPTGPREGIVINLAEKRLYHYTRPDEGPALVSTYPVSIGPDAKSSLRQTHKVAKRMRKPSWTVPAAERKKNPRLPAVVPPGSKNPLGEYAMTLDAPGLLIHGTNEPNSIGRVVGRGGVRLYPEDIAILVHRTVKDEPVRFVNESFKHGYKNGALYFEIHKPASAGNLNLAGLVNKVTALFPDQFWMDGWQRVRSVGEKASGVAEPIEQLRQKSKYPRRWMLQLATYKNYSTARKLMLQLEELDLPVTTKGCETGKCKVLAGPFTDREYMKQQAKKIKWITRIKAFNVPYQPENDLPQEMGQKLAMLD